VALTLCYRVVRWPQQPTRYRTVVLTLLDRSMGFANLDLLAGNLKSINPNLDLMNPNLELSNPNLELIKTILYSIQVRF
jgi:hypothetical protein